MSETPHDHEQHKPAATFILRAVLVLIILGCAGALAWYFIKHPPTAEKKEHQAQGATLVKTQIIAHGSYPVKIEVMGQIIPAHSAALKAQVSGKILSASAEFVPGGFFEKDVPILKIDESDYALNVKVKQATLNQANATLKLEQGQQSIARDELRILEQSTGRKIGDTDLALRQPQLEQARATLSSAKASLEQAELDLRRTEITAPFNAIVTERMSDVGNIVSTQDTLATLVNTDMYWVNVEIPVQDLHWLNIPKTSDEKGSHAFITLGDGLGMREGSVYKTTGSVNEQSRMAKLIIAAPDPLLLKHQVKGQNRMVLGDYVKVTIIGKTLENAIRLPLNYVRDNNTAWLVRDNKLHIAPIEIAYDDRDFAYITDGLSPGDILITSDIITPIEGIALKIHSDTEQKEKK